jgi:hypothetical protein
MTEIAPALAFVQDDVEPTVTPHEAAIFDHLNSVWSLTFRLAFSWLATVRDDGETVYLFTSDCGTEGGAIEPSGDRWRAFQFGPLEPELARAASASVVALEAAVALLKPLGDAAIELMRGNAGLGGAEMCFGMPLQSASGIH